MCYALYKISVKQTLDHTDLTQHFQEACSNILNHLIRHDMDKTLFYACACLLLVSFPLFIKNKN